MNLITKTEAKMTSIELVSFINSTRTNEQSEVRHADFLAKVPKVLSDETSEKFRSSYLAKNGEDRPCYSFPKREACLMAMSYSYELQAKVFDHMTALESQINSFKVPQTFKEALLLAVEQQETIEKQEQLLIEQKPKVDFYNQVADSTGSFDMREVSAMLKLPYGRNKLFQVLREKEFLMKDNLPYRKYIDSHFFIVVESSWLNHKTEEVNITKQTRITQKGLNFLQKVLTA